MQLNKAEYNRKSRIEIAFNPAFWCESGGCFPPLAYCLQRLFNFRLVGGIIHIRKMLSSSFRQREHLPPPGVRAEPTGVDEACRFRCGLIKMFNYFSLILVSNRFLAILSGMCVGYSPPKQAVQKPVSSPARCLTFSTLR